MKQLREKNNEIHFNLDIQEFENYNYMLSLVQLRTYQIFKVSGGSWS